MSTPSLLSTIDDIVAHARRSPFYRGRLPDAPLGSWDEFRLLPVTTRQELRGLPPEGLVCVPEEELAQYHESSATTGAPISTWYSGRDLERIRERFARWGVGFRSGERVLVRFPYALSTIGHFVHAAAQRAGACVIPADSRSTITPLPRVVELLGRCRVTILATISMSALMIAETAERAGLDPRRDFPHLRALACAGEPLTPHRRSLLEEIWGVPVFDNYGMTETGPLAMDCPERRLHPWRDHFFMEILDDRLERAVGPGEAGQLVITPLHRSASPVIRYATGDACRRLLSPCACGDGESLEVLGRAEDALWAGGKPFHRAELDAIIAALPARRFWRTSALPSGLRFVVERERGVTGIAPGLLAELARVHGVHIEVELVPEGMLYDRNELMSFGMAGKPVYIDRTDGSSERRS